MNASIRAIILDVYNTLLDVTPGPSNAAEIWEVFWKKEREGGAPPVAWLDLPGVMSAMVSASHRRSRLAGQEYPEVIWHELLASVCGVTAWPEADKRALCFLEGKLSRTCKLMPGAAKFLHQCQALDVAMGLCSNGQSCTETELLEALLAERVDVDEIFPSIRFWSYQHGVAKPSQEPFTWLEAQLAPHGIQPQEIMMIGDNPLKDIAPATARGWQTHLLAREDGATEPNWPQLLRQTQGGTLLS